MAFSVNHIRLVMPGEGDSARPVPRTNTAPGARYLAEQSLPARPTLGQGLPLSACGFLLPDRPEGQGQFRPAADLCAFDLIGFANARCKEMKPSLSEGGSAPKALGEEFWHPLDD